MECDGVTEQGDKVKVFSFCVKLSGELENE